MDYQYVKNLSPENFKRLFGVNFETFTQMIPVLQQHPNFPEISALGCQPIEEQILVTLLFLREDTSYFHVAFELDLDESSARFLITTIASILIQSRLFNLSIKKSRRWSIKRN